MKTDIGQGPVKIQSGALACLPAGRAIAPYENNENDVGPVPRTGLIL